MSFDKLFAVTENMLTFKVFRIMHVLLCVCVCVCVCVYIYIYI